MQAQAEPLAKNTALVEMKNAEAWGGKLPTAIYAGTPIPFAANRKIAERCHDILSNFVNIKLSLACGRACRSVRDAVLVNLDNDAGAVDGT